MEVGGLHAAVLVTEEGEAILVSPRGSGGDANSEPSDEHGQGRWPHCNGATISTRFHAFIASV
jgi:hypothetical protein